jgi:hypothetical protein
VRRGGDGWIAFGLCSAVRCRLGINEATPSTGIC